MRNTHTKPFFRFPEFKENWKKLRLSDFLTRYSETNKDEEFSIDEILSLSSYHGIVSRKELLKDTYSNVKHLNYKKTRINDLVYGKSISTSYPYGLFKVNDYKDGLLSTLYYTFKVKDNVLPKFIDCYFSHLNRANNFLKKYVLVGDRYITVDAAYLLNGKISLPTKKEEQQKIANFLSSIDTQLQTLEKKKEALELYKKGVTQKFFKQEKRFKDHDGTAFPEWEKRKLGNVSTINKGEQLNKIELFNSGKYPSISGGVSPSGYTDKWNQDANTIIISEGGNSCGFVNFIKRKFWCGGHCYYLDLNDDSVVKMFLYHALKFNESSIMRLRVGSGLPNIQKKDLTKFKVMIPSLPEQYKIANFLTSIDQQIEAISQQIQHTKAYKKGLLQQMFV